MKIGKIFLLSSVALMAVACQDKKDSEPSPTPGADVCFGGELEENGVSRTIYGDEVTGEGGAYSFPILWLNNAETVDKVFIASPQCRENFNSGTFSVPADANNRNYAGSFVKKTGAVQWGSTDADFYAIYPQHDSSDKPEIYQQYTVKTVDGFSATNATFELEMPASQECLVEGTTPVMKSADMHACFMYAKTTGVKNGTSPVTLQFKPLSTAIRFKLRGPDTQLVASTVTVSRIRLIGPSGVALAGKFTVNLTGTTPIVTPAGDNTNTNIVTIYTKYANDAYLQLTNGQEIELNAFIIPQDGLSINENWKLEIALSNGKVYTKTLKQAATETNPNPNTLLVAGKIHRLGYMPKLPPSDLDPTKWMEFIPRNVYLSEISIPGSWNSLNKDFQTMATSSEAGGSSTEKISKKTIEKQYAAGCRMFHLDTRFRRINWYSTNFTNLGIANGGDNAEPAGGGGTKVMKEDACPLFSEALGYITANVHSQEYMVVICTFAHNSYEGADWRQKVSDACASNTAVFDASTIDENTTVGDVLGKVIVIVATEEAVGTSYSGSKCLFVQLPNTRTADNYPSTAGYFDSQTIYHGGKASSGITLNCTQAQMSSYNDTPIQTNERGYAPTMDQRYTVGSNILTWARDNYTVGYKHNQWMYQGLGGYKITGKSASTQTGSYTAIANEMGDWISGKIGEMSASGTTRYYPVGLILMNFVDTNETSNTAVDDILQLNNKFTKQFDPNKPDWPTTSRSYNSIVKKGSDAMGWD